MDPVVHFEMPAEDKKRMSAFYKKTFGWQMTPKNGNMGDYILVSTNETDKKGTPKKRGIINGGFYAKKENMPAQYPSIVIAVDDIKKSMKKIEKAGGKLLGEPVEIEGYGWYVSFFDTEGNRVSLMEPTMDKTKNKKD
jgi:uncharacterized protein